ncbi:hypothetical protein CHM34_16670 [Paludifilum halophilum]|uniref:Uncharacterized protein n=1 Tax=Paludifilum halophilum TaxID=1642702 RepID=A0A235B363_9BACL|nr:hypothetical protein CHM34_16670 [Paludifilum halophilum]
MSGNFRDRHTETQLLLGMFSFLWLVDLVLNVWFYIILSKALGEIHQFSSWMGFLSLLMILFAFLFLAVFFMVFF